MKRTDILKAKLGRKLVSQMLLLGILPLSIFAIPLMYQIKQIYQRETRETLTNYARLTGGRIFEVLENGRVTLSTRRNDEPPFSASWPFARTFQFETLSYGDGLPWNRLDEARKQSLEEGAVVISEPYVLENGEIVTVSLLAKRSDGKYIGAELDPYSLWEATRTGNFGPYDYVAVIDDKGRLLASSMEFEPLKTLSLLPADRLPPSSRKLQVGTLDGVGEIVWANNDLWLKGALHGENWEVIVAREAGAVQAIRDELLTSHILFLGLSLCVILTLALRIARGFHTPINDLASATRRFSKGDWEARVTTNRDDEIGELMEDFNAMTRELRETYKTQLRLEREAMVGRLAATVAHEVNNPLGTMKTRLGLTKDETTGQVRKDIEVIEKQVDRISRTIKALLGFAQIRRKADDDVDAVAVIRNIVELFDTSFKAQRVKLTADLPAESLKIGMSADDLQEVIVNLFENARDILSQGNELRVSAFCHDGDIKIVYEDDGPGLGSNPEQLFEAFYTRKTTGTGLGLHIARNICERAGGTLNGSNRPAGGARFEIVLPMVTAEGRIKNSEISTTKEEQTTNEHK